MSFTVTIKNNKTGEIEQQENNVEVIMGAMAIRHDELRCNTEYFLHSCNRTLCGNAYLAIGQMFKELPTEIPWLTEEAKKSTQFAFNTLEELNDFIKKTEGNETDEM